MTGQFATTHWSVVLAAGDSAWPHALAALERLCRTYWYPLYAFARRNGNAPEEAKDSTQAFFAELIQREFTALSPFLSSPADPGEYAKIGERLEISSHAVAAAVQRLRRRYRESVRAEIAHTVPVAADIDVELRHLVELLSN